MCLMVKDSGVLWSLPELLFCLPSSSCRGISLKGWPCLAQSYRWLFLRVVQRGVMVPYGIASKGPGVIPYTSAASLTYAMYPLNLLSLAKIKFLLESGSFPGIRKTIQRSRGDIYSTH